MQEKRNKCLNGIQRFFNCIKKEEKRNTIYNKIKKQKDLKLDKNFDYKIHPRLIVDQNKKIQIISFDIISCKEKGD